MQKNNNSVSYNKRMSLLSRTYKCGKAVKTLALFTHVGPLTSVIPRTTSYLALA